MRALISVSNKDGLVEFARGLHRCGIEIISTGGTAKALEHTGVPVMPVSDVTRFPEMLDGRVKTLHPAVHGGILARRDRPDDLDAIQRHGIHPIDIVVVNLYPFAEASKKGLAFDHLIEEIDIGGPSLVRAAAKNFKDVLVVVSPDDYQSVLDALAEPPGPSAAFRFQLAQKAFAHTAEYDSYIAATLARLTPDVTRVVVSDSVRALRYGENPHQKASWRHDGRLTILQGKELSFTNLLDLDAALRIVREFPEPAAAVIKHTNPCGAATGDTLRDAYLRARDADPLSAFGGIVGLNRRLDKATAEAIVATFIEAVIAPGVDDEAKPVLAVKQNMRVVIADASEDTFKDESRTVLGGVVSQTIDHVSEAREPWPNEHVRAVTRRQPTADEWQALRFAWRVSAHVKSNAVIFTAKDVTLAIGAGQTSRVDAVTVAIMKATSPGPDSRRLVGSVAASDAFFPFRDGLDAIAAAGATAVVQPGGSVRDGEVIAAADEHGLAMVFTGVRHFRH